ncbi:MAG: DUF1003 domain-containing protein [Gammaproteobacteria bacterium]
MSSVVTPIICPVCQGENPGDAVFCQNPVCHKALGEFSFVTEEFAAKSSWLERVADRVTRFTGQPHFITVHVVWFGIWVALNTGTLAILGTFDAYPYSMLGILLAIEAILITSFLLISQNRQNVYTDKRAELDYEVNVRSYRKLKELQETLGALTQQLAALEEKQVR